MQITADLAGLLGDGGLLSLSFVNRHAEVLREVWSRGDPESALRTLEDGCFGARLFGIQGQSYTAEEVSGWLRFLGFTIAARCGVRAFADQVPEADATVTFGYPKIGVVTHPGVEHTGDVHVVDIGIPPALARDVRCHLLEERDLHGLLLPRRLGGHKGTYGHVLVLAGSAGETGAAVLCARGAARAASTAARAGSRGSEW